MANQVLLGDCVTIMADMPANFVDAVVTDPPYGITYMNKKWDYEVPGVEVWKEVLRVLKPGGHLLSFAGSRTQHRMAIAIEDAGFEIRDLLAWVYGTGFPKSLTLPDGQGTALKPAIEPITLARKPLSEKSTALNIRKWGTGGLNVVASRVNNRYPANLLHDGSIEVCESLNEATRFFYCAKTNGQDRNEGCEDLPFLDAHDCVERAENSKGAQNPRAGAGRTSGAYNHHPTVKPTPLMRYLCKLITPDYGIILDPFCGSGSTGKAAVLEGFQFVGIEKEAVYVQIAKKRIAFTEKQNEPLANRDLGTEGVQLSFF